MPRQVLKNLKLDEVSHCGEGVNPEAKVVLFKSQDAPDVNKGGGSDEDKRRKKKKKNGDYVGKENLTAQLVERAGTLAKSDGELNAADFNDIVQGHMRERDAMRAWDQVQPLLEAFSSSVRAAVELSEDDESRKEMLRRNAEQFADRAEEVVGKSQERLHGPSELLESIVSGLKKAFSSSRQPAQKVMEEQTMDKSKLENLPADVRKSVESLPEDYQEATLELAQKAAQADELQKQVDELKAQVNKSETQHADPNSPEAMLEKAKSDGAPQYVVDMLKSQIDQNARNSEAIAKMQREREEQEYIGLAKGYENLSIAEPENFGKALRRLAKGEPQDGDFDLVKRTLDAADEQAKTGELYAQKGHDQAVQTTDFDKAMDAKINEIRKAQPNLTREQAYAKALKEDPDLQQRAMEA
jgi:hypothetical protein